jgi:hypothetical protein
MKYFVPCSCGYNLPVGIHQAGTETTCTCGYVVQVPPLSILREMAGQGAYEAGIIDTVERMIRDGDLPDGDSCAISGMPTEDIAELWVQCESTYSTESNRGGLLALIISMFMPLGRALISIESEGEVRGRDRGVTVLLRVRQESQRNLRNASQRKLKKLLRKVPVYAKLLKEYDGAEVMVKSPENPATGR